MLTTIGSKKFYARIKEIITRILFVIGRHNLMSPLSHRSPHVKPSIDPPHITP